LHTGRTAGISIGALPQIDLLTNNNVFVHTQVMLHELLAKTWGRSGFESFIKRLQVQYARQAAVAAAAAEQQLAGLAEWRPACAGMFMWFKLTGARGVCGLCCVVCMVLFVWCCSYGVVGVTQLWTTSNCRSCCLPGTDHVCRPVHDTIQGTSNSMLVAGTVDAM
jgi:hypothetical protein